jgi:hypothetical protein
MEPSWRFHGARCAYESARLYLFALTRLRRVRFFAFTLAR